MKLLEIQRRMARDVMRPLTVGRLAGRSENGGATTAKAHGYMKPNDRLSGAERLEIYNQQYWYRLLDSLAEDFPALRAVLGRRTFTKLSIAYLSDCPSRSFTLRDLGSRLHDWLVVNPGWHDIAPELVRLEWAYIEAFDAEELREIGPEDLADLDPKMPVALQPYVRLLKSSYPVDELRRFIDEGWRGGRVPARRIPQASEIPVCVAVQRIAGDVSCCRIDAREFAVLQCFSRGGPLDRVLSRSVRAAALPIDEFHVKIQEWLARWTKFGWLCRPELVKKGDG